MSVSLSKKILECRNWKTNSLIFLPDPSGKVKPALGVFCHGYTAHKGDLLTWASRLSEEGMATIIFDIPGHYMGSYNEVDSFEDFKSYSPELFEKAFEVLSREFKEAYPLYEHYLSSDGLKLVLGGHSLGGLLSLKASKSDFFQKYTKTLIGVGLGMGLQTGEHVFQSSFFKSTINLRGQLVSPELGPEKVFPWIKEEKEILELTGQDIHLVVGLDDIVVPKDGAERMKEKFEKQGNIVELTRPKKLSHHQPELAASYIKKILKEKNIL
ncbi:alpha/beta fold hydrolase [Bacteriovoracales bacterium]|nr:alpha/beta fold hydrolase [Bacteriovoracales bacterium]